MRKLLIVCIASVLIFGCATTNPFQSQYRELDNAYNSGRLTYAEYLNLRQNLQFQEMQHRERIDEETSQFLEQLNKESQQRTTDFYQDMKIIDLERKQRYGY